MVLEPTLIVLHVKIIRISGKITGKLLIEFLLFIDYRKEKKRW
jgi:hypothetical protein